ncbi:DUF4255 domain-containing protein [Chloroflexus sp. MS-G]|jgi:hypothetical protein|uniref:DUF4255 domain-containing protein n=1 Tax=Chloroflexus sp. MS-G TaxID=1521187 RepID=UPI0004DFB849|nr:DUF4255 domain-containing protein [Chloroflexus sp. MS-G]
MSNALAIAAVTAVLRDLLQDGLIDHDITGTLGDVTVSVLSPAQALAAFTAGSGQLNLFLYRITLNSGWRNYGLPSRSGRGDLISDPPLALELHYLLTAYTDQDYLAELLLGYAMQLLHETPVLARDAIRTALAPPSPISGVSLPGTARASLVAADLADQIEQVKLTPEPLTLEEISQIWSSLQSPYRPSVAYQASVVLIESRRPTRQALPVRQRNLYVLPFRQPRITQIGSQRSANEPVNVQQPILPGYRLAVRGQQLQGDDVVLRIGETEVAPEQMTDTQIIAPLPTGLRAGVQSVQVIHRLPIGTPPTPHRGVESNVAAFILHPVVTAAAGPRDGNGNVTITLNVTPPVGKQQRVVLLLDETPPPVNRPPRSFVLTLPARAPAAPPNDTDSTLTLTTAIVPPGTYLVRIQVDGAESQLEMTGSIFSGPTVSIP